MVLVAGLVPEVEAEEGTAASPMVADVLAMIAGRRAGLAVAVAVAHREAHTAVTVLVSASRTWSSCIWNCPGE